MHTCIYMDILIYIIIYHIACKIYPIYGCISMVNINLRTIEVFFVNESWHRQDTNRGRRPVCDKRKNWDNDNDSRPKMGGIPHLYSHFMKIVRVCVKFGHQQNHWTVQSIFGPKKALNFDPEPCGKIERLKAQKKNLVTWWLISGSGFKAGEWKRAKNVLGKQEHHNWLNQWLMLYIDNIYIYNNI